MSGHFVIFGERRLRYLTKQFIEHYLIQFSELVPQHFGLELRRVTNWRAFRRFERFCEMTRQGVVIRLAPGLHTRNPKTFLAATRSIARRPDYNLADGPRNTRLPLYKLNGACRARRGLPRCLELHSRGPAQATSCCATLLGVLVPVTTRSAASGGVLGGSTACLRLLGEGWRGCLKGSRRLAAFSVTPPRTVSSQNTCIYALNFANWARRDYGAKGAVSVCPTGGTGDLGFGFPAFLKLRRPTE